MRPSRTRTAPTRSVSAPAPNSPPAQTAGPSAPPKNECCAPPALCPCRSRPESAPDSRAGSPFRSPGKRAASSPKCRSRRRSPAACAVAPAAAGSPAAIPPRASPAAAANAARRSETASSRSQSPRAASAPPPNRCSRIASAPPPPHPDTDRGSAAANPPRSSPAAANPSALCPLRIAPASPPLPLRSPPSWPSVRSPAPRPRKSAAPPDRRPRSECSCSPLPGALHPLPSSLAPPRVATPNPKHLLFHFGIRLLYCTFTYLPRSFRARSDQSGNSPRRSLPRPPKASLALSIVYRNGTRHSRFGMLAALPGLLPLRAGTLLLFVRFQVLPQPLHDLFFVPFLELLLHFLERKVHHVMVMQFVSAELLAEAQPQPVQIIHFVGREIGRVRPQHLIDLVAVRQVNFQIELRLRIAQLFPCVADFARLLFRRLLRGTPKHDGARLQRRRRAKYRVPDVVRRHHRQPDGLPPLFRHGQRLRKKMLLDAPEELVRFQFIFARSRTPQQPDVQYHHVAAARLDPVQHVSQMVQLVLIAHRHQDVARPRSHRLRRQLAFKVQIELIQLHVRPAAGPRPPLGNREHNEQQHGKNSADHGGNRLRE